MLWTICVEAQAEKNLYRSRWLSEFLAAKQKGICTETRWLSEFLGALAERNLYRSPGK